MFGKLLSSAIRVTTLPIDAANAGMDLLSGGDGSKQSRTDPFAPTPLSLVEELRDRIAETAEDIDN